ncbi:exonuclease domain-containing protein [Streptomyces europaeiscabiei]|uniref:exonuclease domain-containing protein n=1 Tax=Streptomyces europaeiscabiei TaxID=146819 RepID=UPI0038D3C6A0
MAGALEHGRAAPGQLREIVRIGAPRLREDFSVAEESEALVRPVTSPRLSARSTALTGIDQERVDREGAPSTEALSEFLGLCRGGPRSLLRERHGCSGRLWAGRTPVGNEVKHGFLRPSPRHPPVAELPHRRRRRSTSVACGRCAASPRPGPGRNIRRPSTAIPLPRPSSICAVPEPSCPRGRLRRP